MFKIALLGDINRELFQELKREFITERYDEYIKMIEQDIYRELQIDGNKTHNLEFRKELQYSTIFVVNKVWLDNIMRYIVTLNIHRFIDLINKNQLWHDIYVASFYSSQITEIVAKHFPINADEICTATDIVTVNLQKITTEMYLNNTINYNQILVNLFYKVYEIVRNIRVEYYKFELDSYVRPLLFFIENV